MQNKKSPDVNSQVFGINEMELSEIIGGGRGIKGFIFGAITTLVVIVIIVTTILVNSFRKRGIRYVVGGIVSNLRSRIGKKIKKPDVEIKYDFENMTPTFIQ